MLLSTLPDVGTPSCPANKYCCHKPFSLPLCPYLAKHALGMGPSPFLSPPRCVFAPLAHILGEDKWLSEAAPFCTPQQAEEEVAAPHSACHVLRCLVFWIGLLCLYSPTTSSFRKAKPSTLCTVVMLPSSSGNWNVASKGLEQREGWKESRPGWGALDGHLVMGCVSKSLAKPRWIPTWNYAFGHLG